MAKLVSRIYAEALLETAAETGKGQEMLEEIETVSEILKQNPEFDTLMKHPGIPKQEKAAVVERVFRGRVCDEITGFLKLVVEKERYSQLPAIFRHFTDQMKKLQKIGVAYVTTAFELTKTQKEQVEKRLLETTGYVKLELYYDIDPLLIGGMVIRIDDRVVDSSVRTKLDHLTKQLLNIQLG